MTKSRKVGLALACTLIVVLFAVSIVPLVGIGSNTASAVTVVPHAEWKNAYNGGYYDGLNENLTGAAFRTQLANLITTTHTRNTVYNGNNTYALQNVWPQSDKDMSNINANTMKWFYSGTVVSADSFGGSVGQTNREHVWAKNGGDTFTAEAGPGADAHHLRPTECQLNSTRSNWGFAEVTQNTNNIVKQNNSSSYGTFPDGLCFKGSSVSGGGGTFFYPAAGYRGATARILMYMQVRYGDQFNLYFVDGASTNNGKGIGKITDLFKWHLLEPPTEEEIYRNHAIAEIQGNRNPFIDHPEYAEIIYCNGYDSNSDKLQQLVDQYGGYLDSDTVVPEKIELSQDSLILTIGETSNKITATVLPAEANQNVTWTTSNSSVATVSDGVVKAVGDGAATITVTSTKYSNVKATLSVVVNPVLLTGLTISPNTPITLSPGGTRQLSVVATPTNATYKDVTWSSDDTSVVTVTQGGLVTAVSGGRATVTATSTKYPSIKATISITVKIPTSITITGTPTTTLYYAGERFDPTGLTVTVEFNDGTTQSDLPFTDFRWLGSDGTTTSEILQVGMTTVICKFGDVMTTVTGITVEATPPEVEAFVEKVEAIAGKTTLQERFTAIKDALVAYNDLATRYQTACADAYATLQQAIESYNADAMAINNEMSNAVTFSGETFGKLIAAVLALAVIVLVKKG